MGGLLYLEFQQGTESPCPFPLNPSLYLHFRARITTSTWSEDGALAAVAAVVAVAAVAAVTVVAVEDCDEMW